MGDLKHGAVRLFSANMDAGKMASDRSTFLCQRAKLPETVDGENLQDVIHFWKRESDSKRL